MVEPKRIQKGLYHESNKPSLTAKESEKESNPPQGDSQTLEVDSRTYRLFGIFL